MVYIMRLLLSIGFCLAVWTQAYAESISYDILLFGNKIGSMVVTHQAQADGTDLYTLVTTSKAKILWIDKSNDSRYQLIFNGGKLQSSVFKEVENGAVKRWCNITWDGAKYQVDSHRGKYSFTDVPTYSSITAYFEGFKKSNRIFYESEGDFTSVEYPEPNTMQFKTSDGHKSIYHYVNGKVNNMEFKISIATIYMVLSK